MRKCAMTDDRQGGNNIKRTLTLRGQRNFMQHIFILNPAAGQSDSTKTLEEQIRQVFEDQAMIYYTTGVGDATNFVRDYCRKNPEEELRFYACGGDGTLSEVASGAYGFSNAAIGLVPVGTGNDFVRNFLSKEKFLSIEAQRNGREITIDLMRCNDRYCVNMFNTGFDCEVVKQMQVIKRKVPAGMAYALGVVIELIKKPCAVMKVTADGEFAMEGKKLLCAVANGGFYGGGYHPLPDASPIDGYMDVCTVENVSRVRFVSLIGKYKKGTHITPKTKKIIKLLHCRSLCIEFPEPRSVSLDGELVEMSRCELEMIPGALKFVLPQGSELCVSAASGESSAVDEKAKT
jgi:YegS/Rv2252/BmrU family lipid kinase